MDIIKKHFTALSPTQLSQFEQLGHLYPEWNDKINVISRKDIENLYTNHILHSLAIAKYIQFKPNTKIIDLGSGGGFPGVPLAIMFPETNFILVDSIAKKMTVAQDISEQIGLKNVQIEVNRVENLKCKVHFIVSRAVAPLPDLVRWGRKLIDQNTHLNYIPNGFICLKGGSSLKEEIKALGRGEYTEKISLKTYFPEVDHFDEKSIIYVQA